MRAMLLCAGLGTRLGALSDERPKPLLPACDVPLLRYGLALLEAAGVREVAINVHHRGDLIEQELARGTGAVRVTISREAELLGTGGGILRMADWLSDGGRTSFFVLNGKLVIDADLPALAAVHEGAGAEATMLLREVPDADRWGRVDLDRGAEPGGGWAGQAGSGRVLGLPGEAAPRMLQRSKGGAAAPAPRATMFTGVHVLSPSLVRRLPAGVSCVIRQGYLPALRQGALVAGLLHRGYFQEHSTPARYLAGNFALLRGETGLRHPPAPLAGVAPDARLGADVELRPPIRVGPGATVGAGARLGPDVVVGAGASVEAGARLERVVVWSGAAARGALTDAIVTAHGPFLVAADAA